MKQFLIIPALLLSFATFAQDIRISKVSGMGILMPGLSYDASARSSGMDFCVKGKLIDEVMKVESLPSFDSKIVSLDAEDTRKVSIVFKAAASHRRVQRVESPKLIKKKYSNCKSHYIRELQIGAEIEISRSFTTGSEEERNKLAKALQARVTDLRSVLSLNVDDLGISISGGGLATDGIGATPALTAALGVCFWMGSKCEEAIELAYKDAAELDKNFPAERVKQLVTYRPVNTVADFGNIVEMTISPIKK